MKTRLLFPFVDDVDDAGHSGRVVARRGVVQNLNSLYILCGDAIQAGLIPKSRKARLLSIDQDRDSVAASKHDFACLVYRHARQAPHRVQYGPTVPGDIFPHVIHPPVECRLKRLLLDSDYNHFGEFF